MSLGNYITAKLNGIEEFTQNAPGHLFPIKILAWSILFMALFITNMFAIFKWPFSALSKIWPKKVLRKDDPIKVSSERELSKLIAGNTTVLVDFWAEWCGPCLLMGKTIKNLAHEYQGKVTVVKVDVSMNSSLSKAYAVRGLPTFIVFKGGKEITRKSGSLTKRQLTELINGI